MPNQITVDGIETATQEELVANFTAAYEAIYGTDINLDSDTPDGQMLNIFVQAILDLQDLLTQIYNGFNPDNAIGVTLDQRVAINGIQRQAGTRTLTNITVTTDAPLNLYGVDQDIEQIYTITDNAGTQWELINTQLGIVPGVNIFPFQAVLAGATLTIPNTITTQVTIVIGVVSVNNPTAATSIGLNEESDADLRLRRQRSVSLASQGYLSGLIAALENINGITFVYVQENTTGAPDGDGVPGHSIWVIVSGTADNAEIAQAIYRKRNAGCGMFGAISYDVTQIDGSTFTVFWDVVVPETLYIQFNVASLDGVNDPNIAAIRAQLPAIYVPGVNEQVDINGLACAVQEIDSNTLITSAGFSKISETGPFTDTLEPTSPANQFAVTADNIIILPMILYPKTSSVATLATVQFTPQGGWGAYIYTIPVNNSGAGIDVDGLYTAGGGPGVDTVRATDALGNFAEATVTVS